MEPTDLVGLPYIKDEVTCFARPHWWPVVGNQILFIEEVDRCSEQMFPVIMQLIEARTAGGRKLPSGVRIVAACNGTRFMVQDMDQGLMRRFATIDYKPTVGEWLEWAETERVDSRLIEFIKANPASLDTPEGLLGKPNISVPCRASWHDAATWLSGAPTSIDKIRMEASLATFVGLEAAKDFAAWAHKKVDALTVESIFSGKAKGSPEQLLAATHLAGKVAAAFDSASQKAKENALDFYLDVGDEGFALLFAKLSSDHVGMIHKHGRANKVLKNILGRVKK